MAFRGLRDGAGLLPSLRRALAAVGPTPPELLAAMRHEVFVHGRPRRDSDRRRRAAPLVARFGVRAVERALLTVKLIHNMHLTTCSWGH